MANKFHAGKYFWFGVAFTVIILVAGLMASGVIQFPKSGRPANDKMLEQVEPNGVYNFIDTQESEIRDSIGQLYPFSTYEEQLVEQIALHQASINSADLVERIALNREQSLLKIKHENASQSYEEKIDLLIDIFQYLDELRLEFTSSEYNSAQTALMQGNTELANMLLFKVDTKYRVTLGGSGLDRAAYAVYLQGRIAEDQIDYRTAYQKYRQAVRYDPENIRYLLAAGKVADNIALYGKAIIYYEAALHHLGELKEQSSDETGQLLLKIGRVWESKANNKKARDYYQQAVRLYEANLGETHPLTISAKENLERVM